MSKIFFCGDNHTIFQRIVDAVRQHRPDAIVLLGDIEACQPLEAELAPILGKTQIRFIHGNHDTDTETFWHNLDRSTLRQCNLHARVDEVAGVRIAGLGGVFRSRVWRPPGETVFDSYARLKNEYDAQLRRGAIGQRRVDSALLTHLSSIFPEDYETLRRLRADVLVTHEAPSCHPHGFEVIDQLARAMGVKTVFHGHHHDRLDYQSYFDKMGFRTYGVGLRGITDQDGNIIVPGEDDTNRFRRQSIYFDE